MPGEPPSRDVSATRRCPVCGTAFRPGRADQAFCGENCRKLAWRRQHQAVPSAPVVPPGQPRRPITVHECQSCGSRSLGSQRCEECNTFGEKVGIGGLCPHCDEPVAISELLP
jgi:hypothetical protein